MWISLHASENSEQLDNIQTIPMLIWLREKKQKIKNINKSHSPDIICFLTTQRREFLTEETCWTLQGLNPPKFAS